MLSFVHTVRWHVCHGQHTGLASHLYRLLLLPPRAPVVLPHSIPFMSNSETMFERCQQKKRRRTATETRNERAAALLHLHIATSPTLTPQCCSIHMYHSLLKWGHPRTQWWGPTVSVLEQFHCTAKPTILLQQSQQTDLMVGVHNSRVHLTAF